MDIELGSVVETVVIGVGIVRITPGVELLQVRQSVAVEVAPVELVEVSEVGHLPRVQHPVVVGVGTTASTS